MYMFYECEYSAGPRHDCGCKPLVNGSVSRLAKLEC